MCKEIQFDEVKEVKVVEKTKGAEMNGRFHRKTENILRDEAKLNRLVRKAGKKIGLLTGVFRLAVRIPVLCRMTVDYVKGRYREVPRNTVLLGAFAVVYFVSPVDLIPDPAPGGYLDDAVVAERVLNAISDDIDRYKEWKNRSSSRREGERT